MSLSAVSLLTIEGPGLASNEADSDPHRLLRDSVAAVAPLLVACGLAPPNAMLLPVTGEARRDPDLQWLAQILALLSSADSGRRWCTQMLLRDLAQRILRAALLRLNEESWRLGRPQVFAALLPFLDRAPAPGELDRLHREVGVSALALARSLRRLRAGYRERVDAMVQALAPQPGAARRLRQGLRESFRAIETPP